MDTFCLDLFAWLVKTKQQLDGKEPNLNAGMVANSLIEKVAIMLLQCADIEDQAGRCNKSTVSAFYSAGMLLDVCMVFEQISEDLMQYNKYAKWRASHLLNCLNTGKEPSVSTLKSEGMFNKLTSQKPTTLIHSDLVSNHPVLQDSASALPHALPSQSPLTKVPATIISTSH